MVMMGQRQKFRWVLHRITKRDQRQILEQHLSTRQRCDIRARLRAAEAKTPRYPNAFTQELYRLADHYGVTPKLIIRIYLGTTR
jgi:hypothetical protein